MNISKPFLALIGHGTTGKDKDGEDDVERGIHLRWQFRREMGFPLGCFRLYRRPSNEYSIPICLGFQKVEESEVRKSLKLGLVKKAVTMLLSHCPLFLKSLLPKVGIKMDDIERLLVVPKAEISVTLPECAYRVTVHAKSETGGNLTVIGRFGEIEVNRSTISVGSHAARSVTVQASAIDNIILEARSISLYQVCYLPSERCSNNEADSWRQIAAPICLPIGYRGKPSKEPPKKPESEWLDIEDRLPEDPDLRARYGGERAEELASVLRTLVDPEGLTAQADRLIEATPLEDDCSPPGQKLSNIYFPAIDAVLMAAIDPVIAKVVGLYFVDKDHEEGQAYDYKIEGYWPYNTLWHLSRYLTFDDYSLFYRFSLNIYSIGELSFRSSIRPTLVDQPSKWARTEKALAFIKMDEWDWNFPDIDDLPFTQPSEPTVEIRFPEPVGEVQIHLGQKISNVNMEAWDDERSRRVDLISGKVTNVGEETDSRITVEVDIRDLTIAPTDLFSGKLFVQENISYPILSSTQGFPTEYGLKLSLELSFQRSLDVNRPMPGQFSIEPDQSKCHEDILAVHGYQATDQITRIVLKGTDFWLYKICWDNERIPHGKHCACVYGLKVEDAEPLKPPTNVKAVVLPGLVKKVADCQPLLEGETLDARYALGVSWDLPQVNDQLLPKSSIRYHIGRSKQFGEDVLLTKGEPIIVTPASPEILEKRQKDLPEGWPEKPSFYIDSGLEPGKYKYCVAGIDLFGRKSPFSHFSRIVGPKPPPPPMPANVSAYFIDRNDPFLSEKDQNDLPTDIDEAIRLRWVWSEHLDRMSPNVQNFNLHYMPGIPNVLLGEITNIDIDSKIDGRIEVTAQIEGLNTVEANLLAGRLLFQGGKTFRILAHKERIGSSQPISFELRLPPQPSKNEPISGTFSVALEASIPADVMSLSAINGQVKAKINTTALRSIPSSGLQGGFLAAAGIEASIINVDRTALTADKLEIELQLKLPDESQQKSFLSIPAPFFSKLALPPPNTDAYKDYSKAEKWPTDFTASIPKTTVGEYDLLIRKASSGETVGLSAPDTGKYVLIVDQLPPGLTTNEVKFDKPRGEGHFAVSCTGPGGQGYVSVPAGVTRIYRGDTVKQNEVLAALKPPIATPENVVLPGPPNFEGKLTHEFSWPKADGWRYEVYRTLDDTLFKNDKAIREEIEQGRLNRRFEDLNARQMWLENFPALNRSRIEELIINPTTIDLQSIEEQEDRNILLQALASLPYNDRTFTRLNLDEDHLKDDDSDPTKTLMKCIDDTIEGRARGRYFYRVKAIDSVGNAAPMTISTRPVYVLGDLRPSPPVITKIEGGDRQIVIRWAAISGSQIKGYLVYRTDDQSKTTDFRRMELVKQTTEYEYIDDTVEPRKSYYYGVLAISETDNRQKFLSKISEIKVGQAYDLTPPEPPEWIELRRDIGVDGEQVFLQWKTSENVSCLVKRRLVNSSYSENITDWINIGVFDASENKWLYSFADDKNIVPGRNYVYQIKIKTKTGNINVSAFSEIA